MSKEATVSIAHLVTMGVAGNGVVIGIDGSDIIGLRLDVVTAAIVFLSDVP